MNMLRTYSRQVKKESPDLSKICRMCLSQFSEMLDIFVADVEPLTNVSVIKFCVGVECEEKDGLPSRMCSACYQSLVDFFAFKRMCLASDSRLKSCRDAAALKESEASIVVEDIDEKVEVEDELSLAQSNDLGLLETDCIHPGAPDEVLSQIKKSNEDEDWESPLTDSHREAPLTWVPKPSEEVRVLGSQHLTSTSPSTDSLQVCSIPQEKVEDCFNEDDDEDDIDAFLPPAVRASQQCCRVSRVQLPLENENVVDTNQSSCDSKIMGSGSSESMNHPHKELGPGPEAQVTILALNRISVAKQQVNIEGAQSTMAANHPDNQEATEQLAHASAPVKQEVIPSHKPMIGATAPHVLTDANPETAFRDPRLPDDVEKTVTDKGSKKFTCQECAKQFLTPNSLRRHLKNHGPAEWKCSDCGKMFHQLTSMKRHQVLHSGRRFACPDCSKVLLSRDGLKCHMRTHHSERKGSDYYKFKCSHCNKSFAHSSGLSRHMAIHRGVHYQCELCSKKFNDSSQVKRHRIKHHPTSTVESNSVHNTSNKQGSSASRNIDGTDSEEPTSLG